MRLQARQAAGSGLREKRNPACGSHSPRNPRSPLDAARGVASGLAGGDHLHLSLLVGGEFVNPQEWWDPHWIQDNVTKKMAEAF